MKEKMASIFLHLGSNVGHRQNYIQKALLLIEKQIGQIIAQSRLYETEAWGVTNQAHFLNQAIQIQSSLSPNELLDSIHSIEQQLDRERIQKWHPRTIDIDILFYDTILVDTSSLSIPHPQLHKRNFVLVPMLEIAPELEHPILKQNIKELYSESKDEQEVWVF